MYRLSEHSLAIEKGRRRQTWLSREDRLCAHCPQNEVETELHFLTSCPIYDHIRDTYFPAITQTHKELQNISNFDKHPYLLAAVAVLACMSPWANSRHKDRWNKSGRDTCCQTEIQWRTITTLNTTYIYVTTPYIDVIWHLKCLNSFRTFVSVMLTVILFIIYFTCFGNVNICFPCK
jgi:hypothetical protein